MIYKEAHSSGIINAKEKILPRSVVNKSQCNGSKSIAINAAIK